MLLNDDVRGGFDAGRSHDARAIRRQRTHQEIAEYDGIAREVIADALGKVLALVRYAEHPPRAHGPQSDSGRSAARRDATVNLEARPDERGILLARCVDRRLEGSCARSRCQHGDEDETSREPTGAHVDESTESPRRSHDSEEPSGR